MRRLLAILLLAAFGLPTVAPLLAQTRDPDRSLPACCRRNGAHHCAMGTGAQNGDAPAISALCPSFPRAAALATLTPLAFLATHPSIALPGATQPAPTRAGSQLRISHQRTRQDRGPPARTSL